LENKGSPWKHTFLNHKPSPSYLYPPSLSGCFIFFSSYVSLLLASLYIIYFILFFFSKSFALFAEHQTHTTLIGNHHSPPRHACPPTIPFPPPWLPPTAINSPTRSLHHRPASSSQPPTWPATNEYPTDLCAQNPPALSQQPKTYPDLIPTATNHPEPIISKQPPIYPSPFYWTRLNPSPPQPIYVLTTSSLRSSSMLKHPAATRTVLDYEALPGSLASTKYCITY